jgi:phosphatidylinositol-3-phosphatase
MRWSRQVFTATLLVQVAIALASAGPAAAATNLLPNGDFEGSGSGSLSGWSAINSTLSLANDGFSGSWAGKAVLANSATSYGFDAVPRPVTPTVAGVQYSATGEVRSDTPGKTVCIHLIEYKSGTQLGSVKSCKKTGSAWSAIPTATYTTVSNGGSLRYEVTQGAAAAGDSFEVDALSLASAPTVPTNLHTTLVRSTSINLAWSEAGTADRFTVYRSDLSSPLATVPGTQTSYSDTSLSPSTTYTYTVDAVDSSGNHTAQSNPLQVTTAAASTAPCGLISGPPATYDHVVVIMEENLAYSGVIGNANAPYFNNLAQGCALATNYHEAVAGSQPNYMAATGGYATAPGVFDNTPSIFSQVSSWTELEESMGSNCGGKGQFYKQGHDPAFWYTPLAAQCAQFDVPITASDSGASNIPSPLPAYTFITPNLCHDYHWITGCSEPDTTAARLQSLDTWLAGTVQQIAATSSYQAGGTLILITFDESGTTKTTQVATIAVAAGVQPVADNTSYDHYALLRATEEALGITTFLGNAASANDMRPGMGF